MANWRVSREVIEMLEHPNAERLQLANVGGFQVVCQKGLHETGKIVIVIPHNSVLPEREEFDGFKPYLKGPAKNRVMSQRLRGELSMAIVIPDKPEFAEVPIGEDISEKLDIKEYIPEVPAQLAGKIRPVGNIDTNGAEIHQHDVEQFRLYIKQFEPGEEVIVTEKVHGTQFIGIRTNTGKRLVSSKGMLKRRFTIDEDDNNFYWKCAKRVGLFEMIDECWPEGHVQVHGEGIPCQKGFSYGMVDPILLVFKIIVNDKILSRDEIPVKFQDILVPVLYRGPFNLDEVMKVCEGSETVSGKSFHIKEGGVLTPVVPRKSIKGHFDLALKILNSKYKEDPEAFN
jgi:RNA ligase (TIGR02306 family)